MRFDERDRLLLEFASHHRVFLPIQVKLLLRESLEAAQTRLESLRTAGLIREARGQRWTGPGDQVTNAGLRAIDSPLGAPRPSAPSGYEHDLGLGWLWLAARAGAFGPLRGVVSERQMRSHDRRTEEWEKRFGVRLGGVGPAGHERLHYPDLVLETRSGRRVALELELTSKRPPRLGGILAGYAADRRIDAVVYMVKTPAVGRTVQAEAARMGISDLVHVQQVSFDPPGGRAKAVSASRARLPRHTSATAGTNQEAVAR